MRFRHRLYPYCNQDESVRSIENERFLRRDVSRLELRDRIQVSGDHKREVRRHEDGGLFFILIYNSLEGLILNEFVCKQRRQADILGIKSKNKVEK